MIWQEFPENAHYYTVLQIYAKEIITNLLEDIKRKKDL